MLYPDGEDDHLNAGEQELGVRLSRYVSVWWENLCGFKSRLRHHLETKGVDRQ